MLRYGVRSLLIMAFSKYISASKYIDAGTYPIRHRDKNHLPTSPLYQWYDHDNQRFYGASFQGFPEAYYLRIYLGYDPRLVPEGSWLELRKESMKVFSKDRAAAIKAIEAHSGESLVDMYKSMDILERMAA